MGSGIAEVSARAGMDVTVIEANPAAAESGRARIEKSLSRAVDAGKLTADEMESALARLRFGVDIDELADRQLVVEAIVEDEQAKTDVFRRADKVVTDPDAVLASNTSSIPIMKLAMSTERPENVIGIHFFNPVPVLHLVELVTSLHTSDAAIDRATHFAGEQLGKRIITSQDRAGFIVNALLIPYILSAIRMFESGFASKEDIDQGMVTGCAHPMGPLALADLIGLDTTKAVAESLYDEFREQLYARRRCLPAWSRPACWAARPGGASTTTPAEEPGRRDDAGTGGAMTAIERTFVGLPSPVVGRAGAGGHPCQGIWHAPAGVRPRVGVVATHYNVDFSEHYLAPYLAARGIGFLGWNTRFRGDERTFLADHALAEIGVGVRWLREVAGVEVVVLLGNSGGGSLMAAYQSQAVDPAIEPVAGLRPVPGIDDLPPGDLFVALAAHPGRPEIFTNWLDAAAVDEADPLATDPSLDIYEPTNGPPFDPDFVARVRAAQRTRSRRITEWVLGELARCEAAGFRDRLFTTHRVWADPRFVDPTLDPNRRPANHCYLGDPARANRGIHGVGLVSSLRTWLSMWSLDHSPCQAGPHLARVVVPTLVVEADADAGVFPSDGDALLAAVAAADATRLTLSGDHYFLQPEGARDAVADAVAAWITERV